MNGMRVMSPGVRMRRGEEIWGWRNDGFVSDYTPAQKNFLPGAEGGPIQI